MVRFFFNHNEWILDIDKRVHFINEYEMKMIVSSIFGAVLKNIKI